MTTERKMRTIGDVIEDIITRASCSLGEETVRTAFREYKPLSNDEYEIRKAERYNAMSGTLNEVDGVECDICRNKGDIWYYTPEQGAFSTPCECMVRRKMWRLMKESGLEGSLKKFSEYETPNEWQAEIKQKAIDFTRQDKARCFYIGGGSGSGKTHICSAIVREYLKKCREVRYVVWVEIMEKLTTFSNPDRFSQIDELVNVDVLYIDDFYKPCDNDRYQSSEIRKTFEIIDKRYKQPGKITIISSELTLEKIGRIDTATAGRIYEMCGKGAFKLATPASGSNYRFFGSVFY